MPQVTEWINWCRQQGSPDCRWLLHEMHQALDYLGANPECVLNAYRLRVNYYIEHGFDADGNYAHNNFGWHVCSTVIDPIVVDIPAGDRDNDIGLRLSDTDITLAERCRVVLLEPYPDIELETGWWYPDIPPDRFGQDCDAWAAFVMSRPSFRGHPACSASSRLANEWMEHVHGQHERYFGPIC